ncbi:hypothetical protein QJQ45_014384, partial [Haematococcus lacustris]
MTKAHMDGRSLVLEGENARVQCRNARTDGRAAAPDPAGHGWSAAVPLQVAEEQVSALEQSTWLQDFDPVIAQSGLPQARGAVEESSFAAEEVSADGQGQSEVIQSEANPTHHLQALSSSLTTPAANSSLPAGSGIWDRLALPANLSALLNRTALGQRVGRTDRLPLPANMTQLSALLANMTERAVGLRGNLSGQLLGNLTARGAGLAAGMGAAR